MTKRKRNWIAGAMVACAVAATIALLRSSVPPPDPQSPKDAVQVVASKQFQTLSPDQQQAYVRTAFQTVKDKDEGSPSPKEMLSENQLVRLRENMGAYKAQGWKRRIQAYHAMSPAEQVAYLDRMIDEEEQSKAEKTRSQHEGTVASGGKTAARDRKKSTGSSDKGGDPGGWLKESIESTSPEERAQSLEFKKALRDRRSERGLESW